MLPPKPHKEGFSIFDDPVPIELVYTNDPYTRLRFGSKGNARGWFKNLDKWQLTIDWEDGSNLMLIEGVDKWKVK